MTKTTTILIADDDAAVLDLAERMLARADRRIIKAQDGAGALAAALAHAPDLIVLDVQMPGMDGFGVCAALRADARTRNVPILFLTGDATPAGETRALCAGADRFLSKPFYIEHLPVHVESLLRRSRACLGANPLTGLPGNAEIEGEVRRRLDAGRPFWVHYLDIRRFKEFNDTYGFAAGDEMLRAAAGLFARLDAFVGHVGGDDFVVVADREIDAERLRRDFEALAASLFAAGYLRRGWPAAQAPGARLASLAVGSVHCAAGAYESYEAVAAAASERKQAAKLGETAGMPAALRGLLGGRR